MAERLLITRKEGAVLSCVGLTPDDQTHNYNYIGVEFEEDEKEKLVQKLIEKGLLKLRGRELVRTAIGKTVTYEFDVMILKEG
ncbi:MAG: hypothetical protein Q8Q30_00720 [Candidatus Woesebacteria bacterium]|nr:hypothetical protein [Candidatus Woesebacteria bacterium]